MARDATRQVTRCAGEPRGGLARASNTGAHAKAPPQSGENKRSRFSPQTPPAPPGSARPRVGAAMTERSTLWCNPVERRFSAPRRKSALPGGGRALPGGALRAPWLRAMAAGMDLHPIALGGRPATYCPARHSRVYARHDPLFRHGRPRPPALALLRRTPRRAGARLTPAPHRGPPHAARLPFSAS